MKAEPRCCTPRSIPRSSITRLNTSRLSIKSGFLTHNQRHCADVEWHQVLASYHLPTCLDDPKVRAENFDGPRRNPRVRVPSCGLHHPGDGFSVNDLAAG